MAQSGEAADSKTVGDKISSIDNLISEKLAAFIRNIDCNDSRCVIIFVYGTQIALLLY